MHKLELIYRKNPLYFLYKQQDVLMKKIPFNILSYHLASWFNVKRHILIARIKRDIQNYIEYGIQ